MLTNRRVSIIITAYNGEAYIQEAIESVLSQTYKKFELLLIDDGSSDGTLALMQKIRDRRVKVFNQQNHGPAHARNRGIAMSRGAYVAFLDQDDLWAKDKLEEQIKFLKEHPYAGFVIAFQEFFFEKDAALPAPVVELWKKEEMYQSAHRGYLPGTLMVRKSTFDKVGVFDETLINTSDMDWFFRARDLGIEHGAVEKVLLLKRFHASNSCYKVNITRREALSVIRRSVHRKKVGT